MTPKAQRCIDWTIAREGGYVNNRHDRGGETYRGISRRFHPKWPGWAVIDAKKPLRNNQIVPELEPAVREFYEAEYWDKVHGDLFEEPLALALFDYAVHSGPATAWGELCEVLGVRANTLPDEMVERIAEVEIDSKELAKRLVLQRATFLLRRGLLKPNQDTFLVGWMQRMKKLKQAIDAMA